LRTRVLAALDEAQTIGELKQVHDQAEALRQYAARADRHGYGALVCAEGKLRAERKGGELLATVVSRGGDRSPGATSHDGSLADLGLTWSQSSRTS